MYRKMCRVTIVLSKILVSYCCFYMLFNIVSTVRISMVSKVKIKVNRSTRGPSNHNGTTNIKEEERQFSTESTKHSGATNKTVPITTNAPIVISIYEHPFSYLHVPISTCLSNGGSSDPFLLVVVKSDVTHIGHRMAIRTTWGKTVESRIKVIFLLGYSPLLKPFIQMESNLFKDVLQETFEDDYKNNTMKTIMGFQWATTHCNNAKYIFFVDDDYIVNIKYVWDHLNRLYNSGSRSIYLGFMWKDARVERRETSKWYISKEEYSDDVWPPYVSGGSMVVSTDIVAKIASAFKYVKPIFIDDVYLGIIAKKLGITLTHEYRFHYLYAPDKMAYLFTSHGFGTPKTLIEDWEKYHIKLDMAV